MRMAAFSRFVILVVAPGIFQILLIVLCFGTSYNFELFQFVALFAVLLVVCVWCLANVDIFPAMRAAEFVPGVVGGVLVPVVVWFQQFPGLDADEGGNFFEGSQGDAVAEIAVDCLACYSFFLCYSVNCQAFFSFEFFKIGSNYVDCFHEFVK